jgi:predicted transcriptional regulator
MSSLLKFPNELLLQTASELETKHLHGLVLTNHFLYRLLKHTLYESSSKEALLNVIDPGNTAVFQKFLERGLDVNLVVRHPAGTPFLSSHTLHSPPTRQRW